MAFEKFLIEIENCQFREQQSQVEEHNSMSPTAMAFDRPNPRFSCTVWIIVEKEINGMNYTFISPPLNKDIDNLKIAIVFIRNFFVFYERGNPSNYFFQI